MLNLSEVPRERWIEVELIRFGDYDRKEVNKIKLLLFLKTPDELQELSDEAVREIDQLGKGKKKIKPSELPHVKMARKLVKDWDDVTYSVDKDGKEEKLPFNDVNWEWLMSFAEYVDQILDAVKKGCNKKAVIESNLNSLGSGLRPAPSEQTQGASQSD